MKPSPCCHAEPAGGGEIPRQPARRSRGFAERAGWIISSVTLVLMPKCPMCVAAWLALATGVGISLPVAAFLRVILMIVCVAALSFMAARRVRVAFARKAG